MALNNTTNSATSDIPTYEEWIASPANKQATLDNMKAGDMVGIGKGDFAAGDNKQLQDAYYKMVGDQYLKQNKPFERILQARALPSLADGIPNEALGIDYDQLYKSGGPLSLDHAIKPTATSTFKGSTETGRDKHNRILTLAMEAASARHRSPQEAMQEAKDSVSKSPGMVERHQDYVVLDIPGRGRVQLTKEAYDKHYAKYEWASKQVEKDGRTGTKKPTTHDPNYEYFTR